ncbi:YIP1 family protein [Duganella sp. FT27W]|uniref:YIP1 family protein n=1 Tax=Duganella sp. FT27W TaxID=2654636 RepID=UPI00128BDFC9|nr:YIP1 family protein [Duganella sp. FT27W]MPQ58888.1 hypothetical protein [Duganella sp. FT27W]
MQISPLARVLLTPAAVFRQIERVQTGKLLATMLAVQLLISLVNIPLFTSGTEQALSQLPVGIAPNKWFVVGAALAMSALMPMLLILFMSAIFFLAAALGGNIMYRPLLSMTALASAPVLLASALRALLGVVQGGDGKSNPLSFAALLHLDPATGWLRVWSYIDLFDLWTYGLIVVGFAWTVKSRRVGAYAAAALLWGLFQLVLLKVQMMGAHP